MFRERFRCNKQRRGIGMSNTHTRYPRICTHSTQNFPPYIALPKTLSFNLHQKLAISLRRPAAATLKNLRRGWGIFRGRPAKKKKFSKHGF